MAEIGVVVVSYNSRDHLRDCVADLARLDSVEVVVVDNASGDRSLETVSDLSARLIPLRDNRGFGAGCNVGWRAATAPFVLFLNPDARIEAAAVRSSRGSARADARSWQPSRRRIIHDDGSLDLRSGDFPTLPLDLAQALFLHRLFHKATWTTSSISDPAAYGTPGSPSTGSPDACLLVRRPVLEELEGWDEGFFMYCEDKDLCTPRARPATRALRACGLGNHAAASRALDQVAARPGGEPHSLRAEAPRCRGGGRTGRSRPGR